MGTTRISGGIFFALLSEIRLTNKRSSRMIENKPVQSKTCTNSDLLSRLGSIIGSQYGRPSNKNTASLYRKCEGQGALGFDTQECIDYLKYGIEHHYDTLYKRTESLFKDCIINEEKERTRFAKQLHLILSGNSNLKNAKFFYKCSSNPLSLQEFLALKEYDFIGYVLAIWVAIICNCPNNKNGVNLFNQLFVYDESETEFKLTSYIKNNLPSDVSFTSVLSPKEEIAFNNADFIIEDNNVIVDDEELQNPNTPNVDQVKSDYDFTRYCDVLKEKKKSIKSFSYKEGERLFTEYYVVNDLFYPKNGRTLSGIENVTAENIYTQLSQYSIIIGSGGQGKSMMMNHLLLDAIDRYKDTKVIPVFICLNEVTEDSPYIDDLIFRTIVEIETFEGYALHLDKERDYYPLLHEGRFLFLFDGLDEIDFKKRSSFELQLNKFTGNYPRNIFIISSRERDKNSFGSLDKYQQVKIMPFVKAQSLEMVTKLDIDDDIAYVKNFIKKLDEHLYDRHTDFASNPLLLTIMLRTYSTVGEIKDSPYEFYTDAFLALSREHDANKAGWDRPFYTNASGEKLGLYLQEICLDSVLDGKRVFSRTQFEDYFRNAKDRINDAHDTFDFQDFLDDLTNSLCIIAMNGSDYGFIHNAFQEYFCTRCLENLDDDLWNELSSIYEEEDNQLLRESSIYEMLYNQKRSKFERYVILPYLKKIFDGLSQDNEYHDFLKKCFPCIKFAEGLVPDEDYQTTSGLPFYEFIASKALGISPTRLLETTEIFYDLPRCEYGIQLRGRNFEFYVPIDEADNPENPTGNLMIINTEQLFADEKKYKKLIGELDCETSYYYEEFQAVKAYYLDIIQRSKENAEKRSNMLRNRK